MTEIVTEMQERIVPEYEQLKKFGICSDEQIRDCIKKRESYHLKITRSDKSIRDYADFIIFEKKVHKWVTEKERYLGKALAGLKKSIASRIIRLYRDGVRQFPYEERFWEKYIQFCKKSVPSEVSGAYENMLIFHGDKSGVWCDAALWAYEYSLNMSKVNEIFFRGLQRRPESEAINKAFFDILLMEASKMNTEEAVPNSQSTEQQIGMERLTIMYQNSKKKITNVSYFLRLLERCEDEKFVNITASLQKMILEDLMQTFPREEILWDALAQRELRGLSISDLSKIGKVSVNDDNEEKQNDGGSKEVITGMNIIGEAFAAIEKRVVGNDEVLNDVAKESTPTCVWQKRTLRCRIELCCSVYKTAVRTMKTPVMWTLYINAMLKLNQDMFTQQGLKRKCLAIAFKEGHESGQMGVDHYCAFIRMLIESPNGIQLIDPVLSEASKIHKSFKLYDIWLGYYIVENDESKVYEIFRKAIEDLSTESFPLWRSTLQFYKTRRDDCAKRLQNLYKEACQKSSPEFGIFRAEYLEYCILNISMQKTRIEYDELALLPPPSLELHQKMASLEAQLTAPTKSDVDRWRLCNENAVQYFGRTHSNVWIDYIKFERDHGDVKQVPLLYNRAKSTLEAKSVDNFISEYTLLNTVV